MARSGLDRFAVAAYVVAAVVVVGAGTVAVAASGGGDTAPAPRPTVTAPAPAVPEYRPTPLAWWQTEAGRAQIERERFEREIENRLDEQEEQLENLRIQQEQMERMEQMQRAAEGPAFLRPPSFLR